MISGLRLSFCLLLLTPGALAATLSAGPADYQGVIASLRPGDTLQLAPGRYPYGLRLHGIQGLPGSPVTIAGARGDAASVFLGVEGRNTVSIKNAAHIVIRDIEIDGRGAYVDGVKAEGTSRFAHHITLENLYIHDLAAQQQSVGISTKCPAWDWTVRGNRITRVGTGMYFGQSDGSAPFVGGLIEGNLVSDTIGYNLQIKHQRVRAAVPGMPTEPRLSVIRRNRFSKAANASTGKAARPNVLVGHQPLEGPGRDDGYAIYQNLFYQNPSEALLQGEGNLAVYSNLFVNTQAIDIPAITIQPHKAEPRDVRVFFNTVLHPHSGVRLVRRATQTDAITRVAGNAVFAAQPLQGVATGHNHTADYATAATVLVAPFSDPAHMSLRPRPGQLLGTAAQLDAFTDLPDYHLDYDGEARGDVAYGAYGRAEAGPPAR